MPPSPRVLIAEALRATPRRVITAGGPDKIVVRVPLGPPSATDETYRQLLAILIELTHVEILDAPDPGGNR